MAQYTSFASGVEVNGRTILSFIKALQAYEQLLLKVLSHHGIKNVDPDAWYTQQKWLNAFREVGEKYGGNTLFAIGKAIPENAEFPPSITDLKGALSSIDVAYNMNHRGGEIGYYKLISFNEDFKLAIIECKNPYPSDFDRGIVTAMVRKFRPPLSIVTRIELDHDKPSRLNGADSCTYKIAW